MKVSVVVTFSNLNIYRLRHQSEKYHCIRISYIFNLCYRGFVLLYQKDAKFEGFKLQVQAKSSDYLVEFRCLPTSWSHIAFTWENNGGTQLKKCNKAGFHGIGLLRFTDWIQEYTSVMPVYTWLPQTSWRLLAVSCFCKTLYVWCFQES